MAGKPSRDKFSGRANVDRAESRRKIRKARGGLVAAAAASHRRSEAVGQNFGSQMSARVSGATKWLVRGRSGAAAAAQSTLIQFLILALNLLTGVITARVLAPAGRGELAAVILVPVVLGPLAALGIPSALIYHIKRDPGEKARLIGASLILDIAIGAVAIVIGIIALPYVLHQYPADVSNTARWFLLTIPLALFYSTSASVFESSNDFWYSNSSRILGPIITFALLAGLLASHHLNVLTAAISYALPSMPIAVKMLFDVFRSYKPRFTFTVEPYRNLLNYGLRSYGIDVLRVIATQIDQILVIGFLSPEKMGLYVVALSVAGVLQVVQMSVRRVLLPRLSARPMNEVNERVGRALRVSAALTFLMAAALFVCGPSLLQFFYGGRFENGATLLRLLLVDGFIASNALVLTSSFSALGRPGIVTLLQGAGLALSIPLLMLLIPRFGLTGAGLALLTSSCVRLGLAIWSYPAILHVRPPRLLLTSEDVALLRSRLRSMVS